ncbi:MAG: class I SAM-dependent methyltransferase [Theionarchaea archaeon]|nr:class I SAM-dependent methyltransferase [Theionarchaea archaeon]MBU7036965.1 class I SAM-dependent methyltransferase [Theionarchaea archaeon]
MRMHYIKKAVSFLRASDITVRGAWVDCGCGHGVYSEALAFLGAAPVIGIDNAFHVLKTLPPDIRAVQGDCQCLPFKDEAVSGILYVNVLHYYPRIVTFVRESYRVLNSTGHLIVIEYCQKTPTSWDPFPLSARELVPILRQQNFNPVTTILVDTAYRPKQVISAVKSSQ